MQNECVSIVEYQLERLNGGFNLIMYFQVEEYSIYEELLIHYNKTYTVSLQNWIHILIGLIIRANLVSVD